MGVEGKKVDMSSVGSIQKEKEVEKQGGIKETETESKANKK